MKIRWHLLRFMYINLILSCCFWLYEIAAAAEVPAAAEGIAAATATSASADAAIQKQIPANPGEEFPNPLKYYKKIKNVATAAAAAAVAAEQTAAESATAVDAAVDSAASRTSAKSTKTTTTKASAVSDTSVNLNGSPSSVNINNNNNNNNNNEYLSVVPNSENNIKNSHKNAAKLQAQVPKNQLNNNKINTNINTNTNTKTEINQLEQNQLEGETAIPTAAEQQQQQPQQKQEENFPEIITELPTVTVTELPVELEAVKDHLDEIILHETQRPSNKSAEQQPEQPFETAQKDELKINDPGGGLELESLPGNDSNEVLPDANVTNNNGITPETAAAAGNNQTAEEVPMPVFSEWAQKQMEAEASREQAMELEQQVVNNSAQRKNATGAGSGKMAPLKLRAKNYASPDCGAKIIASNGDATNTGAVLSHSSDEYMLSTCGSRIWFVVELCEAVQAQKVELANFELFSSSPKNFTVAVSKRFPTRDWSNVGRFAAEDKRTVQTFELHPHLFGKFVRVDIHSHYSKEHFCPISLFRVFGTSEFEAFETEIRHSDELDDFDDDFGGQEQAQRAATPGNGNNIFQSASDAVIQMVKKAAQVLVKPTKALRWSTESVLCRTPALGSYNCAGCNSTTVERINNLLSCQSQQLQLLLSLPQLRTQLLQTRVCQADYDISFGLARLGAPATSGLAKRQSFYLSMLPAEHVGAMCKLLQAEYSSAMVQPVPVPEPEQQPQIQEQQLENITTAETTNENTSSEQASPLETPSLELVPAELPTQLPAADKTTDKQSKPAESSTETPTPADVNIFNVPSDKPEVPAPNTATVAAPDTPTTPATPVESIEVETPQISTGETINGDILGSGNGMDDGNLANWESIDSLLTTTVASITAGGGAAAAAAAVVNGNTNTAAGTGAGAATAAGAGGINLQPKLTHGAQSESVFIRLSNRIKALERNMSLSGQYLEELSRRYKKQVEELQQTLTQQTLTVRTLEDQSRRYIEQEQLFKQQSAELAGEVRALTYQVQACILVIIIVGTCIFLMLVLGTVYYRKLRRQTQQLQPQSTTEADLPKQQQLSRRKSYEEVTEQSPGKQRRPSEEAMLILNSCSDVSRQRKISVCYGSNNNIAANMIGPRAALHRRKGAKHTLHNSLDSAQVNCSNGEHLDKFFDVDTLKSNKLPPKSAKRKSQPQQELKRQESAPPSYGQNVPAEETTQSDFDESLMLDDDDLANFIPNSDLAYNEFMPEGPSGYQIVDTIDGKTPDKGKKSRRVSSPAFFKSPFSKSKNRGANFNGIGGVKGSHSAHEATSWEWYRLRRNDKQQVKQLTVPSSTSTPNASMDSSSLSEINFPFSSTENSFRILGEAIRSSDQQSGANGKQASSSSSGSSASTTSSTTKKKQRSFNNIFRKVF